MVNFFSVLLIFFIIVFLVIFKRKYIFNAVNKKKLYQTNQIQNVNQSITPSAKINKFIYQNNSKSLSEFYKRALRKEMLKLYKGSTADKIKALNIAEELSDKSTLPILRKGLKDMNLNIVELSANLIRKFK